MKNGSSLYNSAKSKHQFIYILKNEIHYLVAILKTSVAHTAAGEENKGASTQCKVDI